MENKKIYITSDYIKLDDLLKFSGAVQTGGQAKILIKNSNVYVNTKLCTQRGAKLREGDIVKLFENTYEVCKK